MSEFLYGSVCVILYFASCALVALILRYLIKIPDEIFRKILHFILLGSLVIWVYCYKTYICSVIGCLLFAVFVYPILKFFERFKGYSHLVTERRNGELKNSLLLVFSMFALIIAICWGLLDKKELVILSIYAWGFGDALAALVGCKFGKHKLINKKSLEGSLAMFFTSFVIVFSLFLLTNLVILLNALIYSIIVSFVVTIVELHTPNGYDTVTCPLSSMCTLLFLIYVIGGIM